MRSKIVAALAFGALAGCHGGEQKKAPPPIALQATEVRRMTLSTFETLDGVVDPFFQSSLATEQGGTIVRIDANEGDRVRQGEVLAQIDPQPLRATLQQQEGARVAAVAHLGQSRTQLPITDTEYDSLLTTAEESLSQALEQQIADRANVTNTKATYVGDKSLVAQGFLAVTTYEQARAAYVAAVQLLGVDTAKVTQARAALAEARRNLLNSRLQRQVVQESQGSVVQAEGAERLTQTQLGETTLTAPFSGIVTARLLDPGAYASPNQAIYQISQLDPTYVDFNLSERDLASVDVGTPVSFTTPAHPGRRYDGRVATINAVPTNGTLLYRARIVMPNPDLSLRGAMLVNVRVKTEERRDVLAVPREAITQDGDDATVFVIEPAPAASGAPTPVPVASGSPALRARALKVRVGIQTDAYVQVISPQVRDGMRIAASRPDSLTSGASVRVAPSGAPSDTASPEGSSAP